MQRHIILPALLVVLLAVPRLAAAQAVGATDFTDFSTGAGVEDRQINAEECSGGGDIALSYTLNAEPSDGQSVELFVAENSDCSNETAQLDSQTALQSGGSFTVDVPGQLVDSCDALDGEQVYVCIRLVTSGADSLARGPVTVEFDTIPPPAPDSVTLIGGDQNLRVEWTLPSENAGDAETFEVFYRRLDDAGDYASEPASASGTRITGLENGVEYEVYVVSYDAFGNDSDKSPIATGTPVPTTDFWDRYRERGGPAATGCTATGAGPAGLALLLIVAFLPALRRRRGLLLVVTALMLLPSAAKAQASGLEESRNWWVEFGLGPYQPGVDDDFAKPGPYQEIFGSGDQLLFRLRIERTVVHFVGQLGIGVGAGYSRASGMSLTADGGTSEDFTRFYQVPLELYATYRFDYAAQNWGVPLALFGRAGVLYVPWWSTNPNGTSEFEGDTARGARPGFTYGGGVMLLLDALDPGLASDFQRSSGVDNTYLFWEWTQMDIDGWGDDSGIDLTDYTWTAGLSIEF